MSELKKLETTGYSSKLDEIAKNDTEVFLKVKLSGRRTFGEYEFEPKNGFAVHFGNHIDVLDLDKCDVYQLDQPQLNENQQSIEEYVEMAIVQLREANLILNKVYEKDRFAREIQDDISEIMGTLRYRYFGEQEEE